MTVPFGPSQGIKTLQLGVTDTATTLMLQPVRLNGSISENTCMAGLQDTVVGTGMEGSQLRTAAGKSRDFRRFLTGWSNTVAGHLS